MTVVIIPFFLIIMNINTELPEIKGFQEVSLIDWEGKVSSILFLGGCNFKCGFCHSKDLVLNYNNLETISFDVVESFLNSKKGWVDGVVITGGEPTLYGQKLINLIQKIKELGFLVKLDTNGTNPSLLKVLIDKKLIDYFAMDIKAPFEEDHYKQATGADVNIDDIILSKDIIMNSGADYEFRTTFVPGGVDLGDIEKISAQISNAKKYCIQQFVPRDVLDPRFMQIKPYPEEYLNQAVVLARQYVSKVVIRKN
ncbi:MAG: anaerobic ribonucleoside-triphosphate reductase activating protein [Candidatus Omnitrophota bacterium]